MKKFLISALLLGAISVGSMAVIHNGNDNPPVRQQHHGYDRYRSNGHCDEWRGQSRRGGCCRLESNRNEQRGYECCDYGQHCDACRYDRCTVEGCHESGKLCPECRKLQETAGRDDMYQRR